MKGDNLDKTAIMDYLIGDWHCKSVLTDDQGIREEAYKETIIKKDCDTLSITAFGIREGENVTKPMVFKEKGDDIYMIQGDFEARGKATKNALYLIGQNDNKTYNFRLYFLKNVFLYQMEAIQNGKILSTNASFLTR